jgi:hypothetical protein
MFGLECMKMEDILVKDGRIVAVVDFENFQIKAIFAAPIRRRSGNDDGGYPFPTKYPR